MSGARDGLSLYKRNMGHLWDVLHCITSYVVMNNISPLWCWIYCRKHKNISAFSIISQNLDITGCCNRAFILHLQSCIYRAEWTPWWLVSRQQCEWLLGSFSKVVATFSRVGHSFTLFKCHHCGCLNHPIFPVLGFVLHIEHVSCVITNCGQQQWVIPSFHFYQFVLQSII